MHGEPRDDRYDVVVVGSGLGGLSTAAVLATLGKKVLVAERLDGPGGYAQAFRRGPYVFDAAVHWTQQARPGLMLDTLLGLLGVRDRCPMIEIDEFYDARFPDFAIRIPSSMDEYVDAHVRDFPHEAEGFRRYMDVCAEVTRQSQAIAGPVAIRDLDEVTERFPLLFRYRTATVGEVLDEYLTDDRLKMLCTASWPYLGLPPSSVSFFNWSQFLMFILDGGVWFPRGGFQTLVESLVAALEDNGGELVVSNGASGILVEDGEVSGVRLTGGQEVSAPVVVSNADARHTFEELVGTEHLPERFLRALHRARPSLSAFVLYAATSLDVSQSGLGYETFLYRNWDHERTYREILAGKPGGMWLTLPTTLDPSLAPPGEHLLVFSSLAAYDIDWESEKDRFTEELLDELDQLLPGVRDTLVYVETATPYTFERYSLNHRGAIYGWDQSPANAGTKRLERVTPIRGLYLAGHWTQPGASSFRVIYSGLLTAQAVLNLPHTGALIGALEANRASAPAASDKPIPEGGML